MTTQTRADIAKWFPPRINGTSVNKSSYGHVVAVGGSERYPGALILTAEASTRVGAGKVSVAFPKILGPSVVCRLSPVVIAEAIETQNANFFTGASVADALSRCADVKPTVIALGPGLGRDRQTSDFVRKFVEVHVGPLVLDADALFLLAAAPNHGADLIQNRMGKTVLTPHPGELAALLGVTTQEIQSDRRSAVETAIEKFRCTIALKGFETLVADLENGVRVNPTGNPGMATAGTGDVLTGVIAGLIAQGLEPRQAAVAGVYIHGLAGDLAVAKLGGFTGLVATDIVGELPRAIANVQYNR